MYITPTMEMLYTVNENGEIDGVKRISKVGSAVDNINKSVLALYR